MATYLLVLVVLGALYVSVYKISSSVELLGNARSCSHTSFPRRIFAEEGWQKSLGSLSGPEYAGESQYHCACRIFFQVALLIKTGHMGRQWHIFGWLTVIWVKIFPFVKVRALDSNLQSVLKYL